MHFRAFRICGDDAFNRIPMFCEGAGWPETRRRKDSQRCGLRQIYLLEDSLEEQQLVKSARHREKRNLPEAALAVRADPIDWQQKTRWDRFGTRSS